jgi:hypothetical protein
VQFEDLVLSRAGQNFAGGRVLVESGLRHLVLASYDLAGQTPQGTLTAAVDQLDFGGFATHIVEAQDSDGGNRRVETHIAAPVGDAGRVDMLWSGRVTASAAFPQARIGISQLSFTGADDIDADIPGGAPASPVALEAARRAALLARLKAVAENADAVGAEQVDWLLARAEVASVAELLALDGGAARFMQLALSFTPIAGSSTVRAIAFPVSVAVLVRDVTQMPNPLTMLLQQSEAVQQRIAAAGMAPRPQPELPRGRPVVMWIVDATWFDDADWPGGTAGNAAARRADRIAGASAWLAAKGIALNAVDPAELRR